MPTRASTEKAPVALSAGLWARRAEIEQLVLTRVYAVADPVEATVPEYAESLRAAVAAALDYGLAGVEQGEDSMPIPAVLLRQARLAAQSGVSLGTVQRRYFSGFLLFNDFLIEEAERCGSDVITLKRVLRTQASHFDRLLSAVREEYTREAESRPETSEQRRAERVKRLLDGELLTAPDLHYDFDGWHIGVVATGAGAEVAVRELAGTLDRLVLLIRHKDDAVWAWLGSRRRTDPADLKRLISRGGLPRGALAIGEPAVGLEGWRLTHRQARCALAVALRSPRRFARYGDVALRASMLQDDLLIASLRQIYLDPLARGSDRGTVLRETLRAYFAADRNVSSAAAALKVNRNTVANRLREIEEAIDRPIASCAPDLSAALDLEDLAVL